MNDREETKALRRWRLILGGGDSDGIGTGIASGGDAGESGLELTATERAIDRALSALYDAERQGSLGSSAPNVARWLGDIRTYFPSSIVRILQKDALERLRLDRLLLEPEFLSEMEPDVRLVAMLLTLKQAIPSKTKDTARQVVARVAGELQRQLSQPMRQAILGSLNRSSRNRRPRYNEIDWNRTIRANLKHYQPDYRTIIPATRIGYGRRRSALRDIILCTDQSGSMATSVVYASIFAAVLASIPAVTTRFVVFDTSVVDLTEALSDPVEVLFGTQLGGGTDIHRALSYCQTRIERPQETIFVLISDLYEGGNAGEMHAKMAALVSSGVRVISLLALNDEGAPAFDRDRAERFAALGIPVLACTPDRFPELMAAAIEGREY
jgi:Mg-chelatase subunit ChlD